MCVIGTWALRSVSAVAFLRVVRGCREVLFMRLFGRFLYTNEKLEMKSNGSLVHLFFPLTSHVCHWYHSFFHVMLSEYTYIQWITQIQAFDPATSLSFNFNSYLSDSQEYYISMMTFFVLKAFLSWERIGIRDRNTSVGSNKLLLGCNCNIIICHIHLRLFQAETLLQPWRYRIFYRESDPQFENFLNTLCRRRSCQKNSSFAVKVYQNLYLFQNAVLFQSDGILALARSSSWNTNDTPGLTH